METLETSDPLFELSFTREDLVLDLIRDPSSKRAKERLTAWTEAMERDAESNPDQHEGRVLMEIARASLYSDAQLSEHAEEAWQDAETLVASLQREDLIDRVATAKQAKGY